MKPTLQTVKGPKGNCLQACIATILDLKLEDVPDFSNMSTELVGDPREPQFPAWWLELQAFFNHRGYCFVEMALTPKTPWMPLPWTPIVLMFGFTDAGIRHCVIGEMQGITPVQIWNPDPEAEITKGVESLGLIVPLDPVKLFQKVTLPKIHIVDRLP